MLGDHHKTGCGCQLNDEGKFWVYVPGGSPSKAGEVLIVCPGCGSPTSFRLARREAARAEPVEGEEGRV